MLEHDELTPEEQVEAAALEKKLQESEAFVQDLLGQGWVRSKDDQNKLVHPGDKDLNVWRHPYTGEVLLSPKLVERLKQDVE